jgi:hemoglobin
MTSPNRPTQETLYRRLGGYDVIAAVVDEFLNRFRSDPRFLRFGAGRSLDSHLRSRQLLVDQICALAGGPCVYTGRGMKTSHAGLGISEVEWQASIQYTTEALEKYGVGTREKQEFLGIFNKYKADIIEKS